MLHYEEEVFDIKKFFTNQKEQFDKALKQLEIYKDNESYVLDEETIKIVQEIEKIVKLSNPYSHISKLPGHIDDFRRRFADLLEKECKPVREVITSDWQKVSNELAPCDFKDELAPGFDKEFKALLRRLDTSNNFYKAIAMKEESDRLKMRCFEEMKRRKELKKRQKEKNGPITVSGEKPRYTPRKVINISIANIFHGVKTIESETDIEELLDYVRAQLKKELKENTLL